MKTLDQLENEIELVMDEAVSCVYDEKGDEVGDEVADFAGYIKPIIKEKLKEAYKAGQESAK